MIAFENINDLLDRVNYLKRTLLPTEGLIWTDILVLNSITRLQNQNPFITSSKVIDDLKMNRCWIYKSLGRLKAKQMIHTYPRDNDAFLISVSGLGRLLLTRAFEN